MGFRTKLDYSDNRQIKQHIETSTHLSGATVFGIPFNQLPVGPDLTTTGITDTQNSLGSTFSGNNTTIIFDWYDERMQLGHPYLSAITPTNSAITQNVPIVFTASSTTVIDGNTIALAYTGVSFDLTAIAMDDLGGGTYSGTVVSNTVNFYSANTLDFTGRTIWADVSGITRTNRLIITENAVVGNVLTCIDSEGLVGFQSLSANTGFTSSILWSAGTGTNAVATKNTGNISSGISSVAEGQLSIAGGWAAHAEGLNTTALGSQGAHAEGHQTNANGIRSHAEGASTLANGDGAHAEGKSTSSLGVASHSEGQNTTAQGDGAHAEGYFTQALGNRSHAEGQLTIAIGDSSHAEGINTTASGNYSHAEGYFTTASTFYAHAEGTSTKALGNASHAEGFFTTASGVSSHTEGWQTTAYDTAAHAEGFQTIASGSASHAEGTNSKAYGDYSHAEGASSTASGYISHAEGNSTTASGSVSHAEGVSTTAGGNYSHAQGHTTKALGAYSHASGVLTTALGDTSFVHGQSSEANGLGTVVLGRFITGSTNDTTYVDNLNIKNLGGSPASILGIDSNGKIVNYGSSLFSGGTVSGNTIFSSGLSANSITISGITMNRDTLINAKMDFATGIYEFSGITMNTGNTFNVGAAKGYSIDNTIVNNPVPMFIDYSGATGVSTPYLLTAPATYVTLTSGGTLNLMNSEPTEADYRQLVLLGVIGHPNGSLSGIGNRPDIMFDTADQFRDMFRSIKLINDGIITYPNTGMTMANTAGKLYGLGIGYVTNGKNNPTSLNISGSTPSTFQYRTSTGTTFANTTTISAGTIDVGGVATVLAGGGNTSTNQRIYLLGNGNIRIQFGQTSYASLAAAIAGAQNESFTVFTNNKLLGILIGILSVRKGAIDLTDINDARFLPVSKFGETVGAAAGIALSTLQSAYNNSVKPQITTNSTLTAVSIQRGSASDNDNVFEVNNGAGAIRFSVNGNGGITGTTLYAGSANTNSGLYSFAQGLNTTASGAQSYAGGSQTLASGTQSHAEGFNTIASGTYAHAEGSTTIASGPNGSHAEGVNTTASGSAAHAEGVSTTAGGAASHAQGSGTRAMGTYSHSSGFGTFANNDYSFVHGSNSVVNADYSVVFGRNITGSTADTTYVDNLNIKTVPAGATIDIGVNAGGFVTVQASDIRLKENISTIENALDKVKALRGVQYQWKDRPNYGDSFKIGFIAQEVEAVEPLLITNINGDLLGVQYKEMTALLVEAVKELSLGVTTSTNTYLETQTILAEDNNIDLNYNGTQETAIGGGVSVLNAKPNGEPAEFKTDINGNWITNNALKPEELIIPLFTPSATTDTTGHIGSLSRDDDYLYVKGINGWKRTNLENF